MVLDHDHFQIDHFQIEHFQIVSQIVCLTLEKEIHGETRCDDELVVLVLKVNEWQLMYSK